MVAQASNITIDQEALRLIAIQAEGGMRDAPESFRSMRCYE